MQSEPLELVFSQVDGLDLTLDVYVPPAATTTSKVPVYLWWHGGGLLQGTRKGLSPHHLAAVTKHNICIVSADYRLAPQTRLPGILADCKSAMEFVGSKAFAEATGGRVDANKIVVSGSSAGGWLSLLAGTGIGFEASGLALPPKVVGIAAIYPITDLADPFWHTKQHPVSYLPRVIPESELAPFLDPDAPKTCFAALDAPRSIFYHFMVQEALLEKLLLEGTGVPASAFAVAPQLKALGKFDTPVYQVHGDIDDKVPCRQARDVEKALQEINAPDHIYEELPGLNHLFDREPECTMESMYAFLARVTK
ncbi:Polyketide synthase [Mycena chlorophos]|uniref:Polyketide synthase n=1 Tax=Mycena chlorophos TaxID=658473 RepID=A0A8H6SU14_MYCCL|nr:Polyketide synthase [Mycena chlorophos]